MTEDRPGEFQLPILPVSHTVLFPSAVVPLIVFEEDFLALVDSVCSSEELRFGVFFALPGEDMNLVPPPHAVGTLAQIVQHKRSPKGEVSLMAQGLARIQIREWIQMKPFPVARVRFLPDQEPEDPTDLRNQFLDTFDEFLKLCEGDVEGLRERLERVSSLGMAVDMALACIPVDPERRQELLEMLSVEERTHGLIGLLETQLKEVALSRRLRANPDAGFSLN
ncbi:MAG: LON peptidase substrate-binding domain-containing protein [Planctomycetota bacterium]